MSCDSIAKLIPLYYYGELSPEEEDRVEEHTHECGGCAREMERQRTVAAALDRRTAPPPPYLLEDCRADLLAAIQGGAPRMGAERSTKSAWKLFLEAIGSSLAGIGRLRTPIGALALIAVGFFAARLSTGLPGRQDAVSAAPPQAREAAFIPDDSLSLVRSVRADGGGKVEVAFDETRRHVVSGRMEDPNIQRLLLAAAHCDNEAVRVESMDLLQARTGSTEVRDAFINAMSDSNAGVRLKALEGLKGMVGDGDVRKTLARVLLTDDNPAIRMRAVDLLMIRRDDSTVGMLQDLVQKVDNNSVRLKLAKALKDMNASVGTF